MPARLPAPRSSGSTTQPKCGHSHQQLPAGSNTWQQTCPQQKRGIVHLKILTLFSFTEQRKGAASISLQPLSPAASNPTADWYGLLFRYPTRIAYVGWEIWWRAGYAYQQIPLFSSGQSRDLAGERHLVANRRTTWLLSQWLAGCFPTTGFAPQPRAEGSRQGTQGRQTRSAGCFHTWSQSWEVLKLLSLPAGAVDNSASQTAGFWC